MKENNELIIEQLVNDLPLRPQEGIDPEAEHKAQKHRPELFGKAGTELGYYVEKKPSNTKEAGRRTSFSFVEKVVPDTGREEFSCRFGVLFEKSFAELQQRYPASVDKIVYEIDRDGQYATRLHSTIAEWARTGKKLFSVDIVSGFMTCGLCTPLDYVRIEHREAFSKRIYSLSDALLFPLLFSAELKGGIQIKNCRLCRKPFISVRPNDAYCMRSGELAESPDLNCSEAVKIIASKDSNLRRKVDKKIKQIREIIELERHDWERSEQFNAALNKKREELKGNPRKNAELLPWLENQLHEVKFDDSEEV